MIMNIQDFIAAGLIACGFGVMVFLCVEIARAWMLLRRH